MSESNGVETAYERGRRHGETGTGPGSGGGGGNFLSKQIGPLPIWAWGSIIFALTVGFYLFTKNKKATATNAASAQTQSGTGTTNSSLIPQFVNQVYTNGNPPPAHHMRGGGSSGNGGTPPATESGGSVTISIPNAGGGSWESVTFPNQAALNEWNAWNQMFVNDNGAQAYRSQWNTELTSLGVTGQSNGQPLTPPNPNSQNPYDRI